MSKSIRLQILLLPQRQKHVLKELSPTTTLADLQQQIADVTSLPVNRQQLTSGFPPRAIALHQPSASITDLNIRHGDTVEVRDVNEVADAPSSVKQGTGAFTAVAPTAQSSSATATNGVQNYNFSGSSGTQTLDRPTPGETTPTKGGTIAQTITPTGITNGHTPPRATAPTPPKGTYVSEGWNCPTCTLYNPNSARRCSACETPNPTPVRATASPEPADVGGRPGMLPTDRDEATVWQCESCTYVNAITAQRCRMCSTRNPHYEAVRGPEDAVEDQLIGGPNSYVRDPTDWECTRCHARNPNIAMSCNTCHSSRLLSLPLNTRAPPTHNVPSATAATGQNGTAGGAPSRMSRFTNMMNNPFRGKNPWECETCHRVQQRDLIRCRQCGSINGQAIADRAAEQQAQAGQGGGGMPMMCSIM